MCKISKSQRNQEFERKRRWPEQRITEAKQRIAVGIAIPTAKEGVLAPPTNMDPQPKAGKTLERRVVRSSRRFSHFSPCLLLRTKENPARITEPGNSRTTGV
jgi:hypothetical protein